MTHTHAHAHTPTNLPPHSCYPVSGWYKRRWAVLLVIKPDGARVISPVRTFTPFSQSQSDVWQLFAHFLRDWLSMPGSIKPWESAYSRGLYFDVAVEREWMAKWGGGKNGEGRRRANTFNKQTNEWVSWTVMRCFIDAIGKVLFCLLVSTGTSDLL